MAEKLHTVVLTGGPCSGKTTVQDALRQEFGSQLLFMPEVPTMLLANGYPRPGLDIAPTEQWFHDFEEVLLLLQTKMEAQYLAMAKQEAAKMVVFDRGILDGAAYMPKSNEQYFTSFAINPEEIYRRYDLVVHLESVASCNPALYTDLRDSNAARFEDIEEAKLRDKRLQEAWKDHPNWQFIAGKQGIEKVVGEAITLVKNYLVENNAQ